MGFELLFGFFVGTQNEGYQIDYMKIFIAGAGKLANALLTGGLNFPNIEILKWSESYVYLNERTIIVHAGSGRELEQCLEFCKRTDSVFIELSTGLETERIDPTFTLIICPNTSMLALKTLGILKHFGRYFKHEKISIIESHQSPKRSIPGTAFSMAQFLNVSTDEIESVRDTTRQLSEIGIPNEFLDKHAYHKIQIEDGSDTLSIEVRVLGHNSYVRGVQKIIAVALQYPLEKRRLSVLELVDKGLL